MKTCRLTAALVLAAGTTSAALAGTNVLNNPGFETVSPTSSMLPLGWANLDGLGRRRVFGDGLGEILVRSGNASIELRTPGNGGFQGFTTNVFNPSTLSFYDPPFTSGEGDAVISGYYAIPAAQPVIGDSIGIKFEFRRENTSIFASFEQLPFADFPVSGHTNGEWVYFEFTVTEEQLQPIIDEFPPGPTSVTVLPFRFGPIGVTSGAVFFDDLSFTQVVPVPACPGDVSGPGGGPDGAVDIDDLNAILSVFSTSVGIGSPLDLANDDGFVDIDDLNVILANWQATCP